jgi:hypothetical protein
MGRSGRGIDMKSFQVVIVKEDTEPEDRPIPRTVNKADLSDIITDLELGDIATIERLM